jgi:putative ABC transport system permease protein
MRIGTTWIERWLYTVPLRLRCLFRRKQVEQELDDELHFHLEQQMEAAVSRGTAPDDARAAALRALDRIELRKEECRDMRRIGLIDNLNQDLRYALRMLRKSPAFTTVAVLSLALGIGANTAIFSLMDVLLLRPLPVKQPDRLQLVSIQAPNGPRYSFNYPLFEQVRDRTTLLETFAWWTVRLQTPDGDDMLLVPAVYASGAYFSALGVPPALGRVFGREDDRPDGGKNGPVAVIADAFWERRFARSPSVMGRPVILNGLEVTIVGVMPRGFFGAEVGTAPDVWVPLNMQRQLESPRCIGSRSCWYLRVMGRVQPGISPEQAAAELRSISPQIMGNSLPGEAAARPDRKTAFLRQILQAERGASGYASLRGRVRTPLGILMALVALVLLIACANMANLLTARASARYREVAIRLAMGAARARVIRQFLTESCLLSIAGAAAGFLIALWSTRVLIAMLSSASNPVVLNMYPDWRVLLFTAAVAMLTGILFGLGPSFRATRTGVAALHVLSRASKQTELGFGRILVGGQVALSVVLLAAAGLFAGSLVRLMTESYGFDTSNVSVIALDTSKRPEKGPALIALLGRIVKRTQTLAGVESASLLSTTPLSNGGWDNPITIVGRTDLSEDARMVDINAIGPRFFETMRIQILRGRDFTDGDDPQSERVAVISENAAHRWFPKGDALGAQIGLVNDNVPRMMRVIGIVGNIKYLNLRESIPLTLYVPSTQYNLAGSIALRTRMPLKTTYAQVREILRQAAPGTPIRTAKTMEQQVDESLATERLTAYLSVFIAALALLLTAVGLYGILAYSVARRTSEIGIRMALGARRASVVWLVIRVAMGHTAAGAVAGIAVVLAASKVIASLLYEVRPNDPATLALAMTALALVCAVAAWLPARRASRLDPMAALRED